MSPAEEETRITVKVNPNSPKNEVTGFAEGVLRVKIAAPPLRDKANKELVAFLSERLGLPKDNVSILKGHTSRNKLVAIRGLSQAQVMERLFPQSRF
ncbi:MAG: DUF167 domain-containing protein [Dehalococcoidia bacterium]|nr:DUF167 domain-containing protein [Dehalococcoidia bacterium]